MCVKEVVNLPLLQRLAPPFPRSLAHMQDGRAFQGMLHRGGDELFVEQTLPRGFPFLVYIYITFMQR